MYRPDEPGFHCAVASNVDNPEWEAETLARPFLRLPFAGAPSATSGPGSLTLSDGELTMEARRSPVLHSVHITVTSPVPVKLHCGPAGVFDRYGYTEGLDPSFFHGYPDEAVAGGCWVTHRNEWNGALAVGPGAIETWGRGVTVALPAGRSVLAFSVGRTHGEAIARAHQVAASSPEQAEAFLEQTWEAVLAKVPESIYDLPPAAQRKALEAIYLHLEDTKYEPYGAIKYAVPCAVVTGYRTPVADWDNGLSAALATIDLEYAVGIVLNFLAHQHEDGSLPAGIEPSGALGRTCGGKVLIPATGASCKTSWQPAPTACPTWPPVSTTIPPATIPTTTSAGPRPTSSGPRGSRRSAACSAGKLPGG